MGIGLEQSAEMAPVRGDDQQCAGQRESCTCDDCPNSMQAKGGNLRSNEPHTGNEDEEKSDFGDLCPRRRAESEHGPEARRRNATFAPPPPERPAK